MSNLDIIQDKMRQLRELHPDWDESALTIMERVERRIVKDVEYEDYTNLAMTRKIVRDLQELVKSITVSLAHDDGNMDQLTRKGLASERKSYLWLITLLSHDYKADLQKTERWIDNELEK